MHGIILIFILAVFWRYMFMFMYSYINADTVLIHVLSAVILVTFITIISHFIEMQSIEYNWYGRMIILISILIISIIMLYNELSSS